ncbi:MAG TPA: GntR family transcriptional regulator [Solirubrobacter sp.]|nr:GntR family transcriptional regulator [Solirubrobacter sp.]
MIADPAIKLGLLPPGTRLPPERDLCEQLGIARSTLRQALTALVQSGHLHAVRGRGGGTEVLAWANAQHARLVDCFDRRDPGAAVQIMADHLRGTEHVLGGLLP